MSNQGFILLYHMIFESLIWSLPYICALLMWQMICLPPPLSPLVTHPPQMKAHQLIRRQRCLILLVVHLGSFANAPSVLVRFHKSHVCVQHIQRFGRHCGLTPRAFSSHVVSVILPLSFFLFDTCYFSWNPLWNYFHFHGLLWFFECNRVPVWHHHPMFYHKGF